MARAYARGWNAFVAGRDSMSANPYDSGSDDATEWAQGWMAACCDSDDRQKTLDEDDEDA